MHRYLEKQSPIVGADAAQLPTILGADLSVVWFLLFVAAHFGISGCIPWHFSFYTSVPTRGYYFLLLI